MPDFEEGRTEMVEDNQWPDMLIALTEVFANTPAALLLLQRFAWQRVPGGAPSYDSNGRAYLLLDAILLRELLGVAAKFLLHADFHCAWG